MPGTMGSLAAMGLSYVTLAVVKAPGWLDARPDWRVLLFTAFMTVAAMLCFGLMPAIQIARQRQQKTLARQVKRWGSP